MCWKALRFQDVQNLRAATRLFEIICDISNLVWGFMFCLSNVCTAPQTILEYEKRYTASKLRLGTDDDLAADLIRRAPELRPSTVRQYRAAYSHVWERIGREDLIDAVKGLAGSKDKSMPRRTSSSKAKAFKVPDLARLLEALEGRGHTLAAAWLRATYITGLRPSEWQGARLDGMRLVVRNGKNTNGRAHGDTRTLHLRVGQSDVHNIALLIARLQADYQAHYAQVRQAIQREARRLWPRRPKRPTLYTARHMFAAGAKAALPRAEVGALMGHSTDRTAGMHYARASSAGGRRPAVAADQRDVARVARVPASPAPVAARRPPTARPGPRP